MSPLGGEKGKESKDLELGKMLKISKCHEIKIERGETFLIKEKQEECG